MVLWQSRQLEAQAPTSCLATRTWTAADGGNPYHQGEKGREMHQRISSGTTAEEAGVPCP